MARPQTLDAMAVDLLLAGDQRGLTRLATKAGKALRNEVECTECGDEGPHQDNGETGIHLAYCCRKCHTHFEPRPL